MKKLGTERHKRLRKEKFIKKQECFCFYIARFLREKKKSILNKKVSRDQTPDYTHLSGCNPQILSNFLAYKHSLHSKD